MIYFMREGTRGAFKIGYTQDEARLKQRRKTLNAGNPRELSIVAVHRNGGPRTERKIHEAFGRHRIRGEWFKAAAGVKRLVEAVQADPAMNIHGWLLEYKEVVRGMDARYAKAARNKRNAKKQAKLDALAAKVESGEVVIRRQV